MSDFQKAMQEMMFLFAPIKSNDPFIKNLVEEFKKDPYKKTEARRATLLVEVAVIQQRRVVFLITRDRFAKLMREHSVIRNNNNFNVSNFSECLALLKNTYKMIGGGNNKEATVLKVVNADTLAQINLTPEEIEAQRQQCLDYVAGKFKKDNKNTDSNVTIPSKINPTPNTLPAPVTVLEPEVTVESTQEPELTEYQKSVNFMREQQRLGQIARRRTAKNGLIKMIEDKHIWQTTDSWDLAHLKSGQETLDFFPDDIDYQDLTTKLAGINLFFELKHKAFEPNILEETLKVNPIAAGYLQQYINLESRKKEDKDNNMEQNMLADVVKDSFADILEMWR